MRRAPSGSRTRSRSIARSTHLLLAMLAASLAAGLAPAAAGAATLSAPQNRLIAPGAAVGFPGSLAVPQGTGSYEVKQGTTNETSKFKLLAWQATGLILRVEPTVAAGTYTLTAKDSGGESEPVAFTVTAASVAGQKFSMLSEPGHASLPLGVAQGPSGETWFSDAASNSIGELTSTGSVVEYTLATAKSDPTGIVVDQAGNVWVADNGTGQVTELEVAHASPGTSNGENTFTLAAEAHPDQVSVDPFGNIWVAEGENGVLGEIVAGSHAVREWLITGDLEGMVVDAFGNVWTVDESTGVAQIVPSQLPAPSTAAAATSGVYHVAGSGGTEQIAASPNGDIWFTQWPPAVLGVVIPSTSNPAEDRSGVAAHYPEPPGGAPSGVGVDAAGNVFVEDAAAQAILEFTPTGEPGATGEVPGTWKEYPAGSWITNYSEGDEGNNLAVLPSGNVVFSGYVQSVTNPGGTPYEPTELIQGYLGTLPGVATPATAIGKLISGGLTSEEIVSGTAGNEVIIPSGTEVKTSAGTPFTGTVPPPAADKSLVPGGSALFGDLVPGSAFSVSPLLSDGVLTHLTFSKCVTVVYSFGLPSGVTPKEAEEAKLYYYNFAIPAWEEAGAECGAPGGTTTVSGTTVKITLLTAHLSAFAAFHHPPTAAPLPPTAPPKKKYVRVDRKTGEIEAEYEFPEAGEAEAYGEVLKGATLARVQQLGLAAAQSQEAFAQIAKVKHKKRKKHKRHKRSKKCKRGFVKKHKRCVNNAPVRYGRVTLKITTAGSYKIRIKPAGKVRAALRKGKTVNVSFVLVFTPSATTDHIHESAAVRLHLKKKHKKKHRKGKHKKKKKKK
jgi:streptogramin lyase